MNTETNSSEFSEQVRGKTIRLSWADGPTKGTTQEHVFHKDGTVEWHSIDKGSKAKPAVESGGNKAAKKPEKPHYAGVKITDDICMVSYLSKSGLHAHCRSELQRQLGGCHCVEREGLAPGAWKL